ncbi:MAG: hypothetical protein QM644_09245 [Mobilitalea sp.]
MTQNIRTIFDQNIQLLGAMDKSVYYFREQQYDKALFLVAHSMDAIKLIIEAIITNRDYFHLVDTKSMLDMLTGILEAKKNQDYILLADLLELQLINFLIGVQELIIGKEEVLFEEEHYRENIRALKLNGTGFEQLEESIETSKLLEGGYRVEFTSCGQMTLAAENEGKSFYFHTNNKIQTEAFLLAKSWYKKEIKRYHVYGLGLGYHIGELSAMANDVEIFIYESDMNVIQLACAFTDIKALLNVNKTQVIYDPEFQLLKERMETWNKRDKLIVHYPSYKNIRTEIGKNLLREVLPKTLFVETRESE